MLFWEIALAIITLVSPGFAAGGLDILSILNQQNGISSFVALLQQFPDLIDTLNNGTFSVLVPNDLAISAFEAAHPNVTTDQDAVQALLQYHVACGTQPSATFGLQPLFVPTLLTNPDYANVTGGQVVEMTAQNNTPVLVSGVKAVSKLVEADIIFLGGIIQIIDSVLTIPLSLPATITKAGLNDFIALLNKGGWLAPNSPAVTLVNTVSDLTVWGPNSAQYGATFTGWDGLSQVELLQIFQYSVTEGEVVYSSDFKNNSKIPTGDKLSLTMTSLDGDFYVDTSRITTTDYLTSNGVLQILDSPLNPNTTDERPASTAHSSSSGGSNGLSPTAGAGIGIALGAVLLGGALVVALFIRNRRRRQGGMRGPQRLEGGMRSAQRLEGGMRGAQRLEGGSRERVLYRSDPNGPPPTYELDTKSAEGHLDGTGQVTTTHVLEVHRPPKPPSPLEIDGTERSRISITIQGSTPRQLGFQARY